MVGPSRTRPRPGFQLSTGLFDDNNRCAKYHNGRSGSRNDLYDLYDLDRDIFRHVTSFALFSGFWSPYLSPKRVKTVATRKATIAPALQGPHLIDLVGQGGGGGGTLSIIGQASLQSSGNSLDHLYVRCSSTVEDTYYKKQGSWSTLDFVFEKGCFLQRVWGITASGFLIVL